MMIGIDFGNSTTCAAFDNGSTPQVIPWPDKGRTGPSVVFMPEDGGEPLVGSAAVTEGKDKPKFCFHHVKRLFNVDYTGEDFGWQAAKGDDGKVWMRGPNRLYKPQEIAFCILWEVLFCAESRLRQRPDKAVLTHPAHWGEGEKACLKEAAQLAELKEVRLISEPSAAGFAYDFHIGPIRHYLIYDWGAGTFDATALQAGKGACDPKLSGGEQVGGINVDDAIVDWLKADYRQQYGTDLGTDGAAMERLRRDAEKAKIALSTRDSVKIEIPLIETLPPRTLYATLTREKLEELAEPFVKATIERCEKLLEEAGLTKGNIIEVVLVGGMTNMPCVAKAVEAAFGRKPRMDVDPDEAVALGASKFAAMIENRRKRAKLIERLDHDFGFETSNDVFHKVIEKGTIYPLKEPIKVLITSEEDGQDELSVHVLEGDGFSAQRSARLAAADLPVTPGPAGEASIELEFDVDADGRKIVRGPDGVIYEGGANVF